MQLIVIATLALVAAVAAAPAAPADPKVVEILRSNFDQQPQGDYVFNYETGDGSKREETGELKTVNDEDNKPHSVVTVRGTYSYVDLEGKPHSYTYYADEEGFHIEGEDIPRNPQ